VTSPTAGLSNGVGRHNAGCAASGAAPPGLESLAGLGVLGLHDVDTALEIGAVLDDDAAVLISPTSLASLRISILSKASTFPSIAPSTTISRAFMPARTRPLAQPSAMVVQFNGAFDLSVHD